MKHAKDSLVRLFSQIRNDLSSQIRNAIDADEGQFYSDRQKLLGFCEVKDHAPPGVDVKDLAIATSLGAPAIDAKLKAKTIGTPAGEFMAKFYEKIKNHPKSDLLITEPIDDIHITESIERVCIALIYHAQILSELKVNGEGAPTRHQKAVPESTINFLAWEMLIRCNNSGILPPAVLLQLIRSQLGVLSKQKSDEYDELTGKLADASLFAFNNPDASLRQIATHCEVNVSTVLRWDKKYNLKKRGKVAQEKSDLINSLIEETWEEIEARNTGNRKDNKKS